MLFASREISLPEKPECHGACLSGFDIGVEFSGIAYAHPDCELHGQTWREQNNPLNDFLNDIRDREMASGKWLHIGYADVLWTTMTTNMRLPGDENSEYVMHVGARHHAWLVMTRLKAFRDA